MSRRLPRRVDSHVGETESETAFRQLFTDPYFLVREPGKPDYGCDLEIEALDAGSPTNARVQIQLKATSRRPAADGSLSCRVEWTNVEYLRIAPYAMYVVYCRPLRRMYFIRVRDVHEKHAHGQTGEEPPQRVTLRLVDSLDHEAMRELHGRLLRWLKEALAWSPRRQHSTARPTDPLDGFSLADARAIDLRIPDWPVKDQRLRAWSPVYAICACVEHRQYQLTGKVPRLSEHFLYWATRQRVGRPEQEGITLAEVVAALAESGVCEMRLESESTPWPGVSPSKRALANARVLRSGPTVMAHGGDARRLFALLAFYGRPVALAVPVFADPTYLDRNNWNSMLAGTQGLILDPPAGTVVVGGHAVCVTGFVADRERSGGGCFVFRNSWGDTFGTQPAPGTPQDIGYGLMSAGYVDQFAWEMVML